MKIKIIKRGTRGPKDDPGPGCDFFIDSPKIMQK